MENPLVYVDAHTMVNLQAVSYVKFAGGVADIIFSNGERLKLEGQSVDRFATYLRARAGDTSVVARQP